MPRKKTTQDSASEATPPSQKTRTTAKKTTVARKTTDTTARSATARKNTTRRSTHSAIKSESLPIVQEQHPDETAPTINGQWRRIDLHMHTPGSHDYEQPEIHYLDILRQAERRGLDIIAFTDHNTINGYRSMQREVEELEMLEKLGRIRADEMGQLSEYRRLRKKILVLPGFEFTATFGFHVIGLFPPEKSLREIEFVLMQLRVPLRVLEHGLTEAGATSDVLTAYRMIDEVGGIVIAPHANSSSGVFMRGMNIGGQTRMAYTQDAHLYAIELTDLAKGRRSMAMWFNGHKPEYSRRMHILQGSDAHRLTASPTEAKRLGMGDRSTEVFLPEVSFNALQELFRSQDFDRVRPSATVIDAPSDVLRTAREKGNTDVQSFHAALPKRGDHLQEILNDVAAFANAEGGAIYIGCDAQWVKPAAGLKDAAAISTELAQAIQKRISPALNVVIDLQNSDDVEVLHVTVPQGETPPYVVDQNQFYVRSNAETRVASRDEIVGLVRKAVEATLSNAPRQAPEAPRQAQQHGQQRQQQPQRQQQSQQQRQQQSAQQRPNQQAQQQRDQTRRVQKDQPSRRDGQQHQGQPRPAQQQQQPPVNGNKPVEQMEAVRPEPISAVENSKASQQPLPETQVEGAPKSGVEILAMEERDGVRYYTVRDLRNKSTVRNVTKKSARDLWLYAIMQHANDVYDVSTFEWHNDRSILSRSQRAGKVRYDLALRDGAGKVHIFYGVADDATDNRWKELIMAIMPPVAEPAPGVETAGAEPVTPGEAEPVAQAADPATEENTSFAESWPEGDNIDNS
jgi:Putative DNA-binding domain